MSPGPKVHRAFSERRRQEVSGAIAALIIVAGVGGYLLQRNDGTSSPGVSQGTAPARAEALLDPVDIVEVVPRDGIPAIDAPVFIEPAEAEWLDEREPVIGVELDGEARAYPLQIMTWHEIVNDVIAGTAVAITFCPLCNTALAYERPSIDGEVTTFGVSGKLINSNLLMYDRTTGSLWPQVTGIALTGPEQGSELERIPAQIAAWADFRNAYPDARVLSRDTGHDRRYGENPYPGYDDVDKPPFLYEGEVDGRLAAVERVLAVTIGDRSVAFPYFRLRERAEAGVSLVHDRVDIEPVVVFWKRGTLSPLDRSEISVSRDVGSAAAFSRKLGDSLLSFMVERGRFIDVETRSTWNIFGRAVEGPLEGKRLDPVEATDSFWFDWAAFHPDTEVWRR